ncbi:type I toxin-antitoxin system Fst family toxin [Enterococcus hirae]|nr:type I toxin-antitoxin system Fst family toxin [Enterococcus hirae]
MHNMLYSLWQLAPKGVIPLEKLISLVIAPIFVGLVIQLISHWLDEKDND